MRKKIVLVVGILSALVLWLNAVVYFEIPAPFFATSLFSDFGEEGSMETDGTTSVLSSEVDQGSTKVVQPKLVENALTYTNRNGYAVFHGYQYRDLTPEDQLRYSYERRAQMRLRTSSDGYQVQRDINFRPNRFQAKADSSSLHASAPKTSTGVRRRPVAAHESLDRGRTVGVEVPIKRQTRYNTKARVSLRYSTQERGGTAQEFALAKKQARERAEINSQVWAQNRTPNYKLGIKRSRIEVKVPDSRKKYLEHFGTAPKSAEVQSADVPAETPAE